MNKETQSLDTSSRDSTSIPALTPRAVMQVAFGMLLAGLIIGFGVPFFGHTTWHDVGQRLTRLGFSTSLELFGLVVLGLWLYTFTLTGSLPGLRNHQALIVNVSGSAASNVLPGGGAAGVAITYGMLRSWGFARAAISTSVIVSGVWNIVGRMVMPLLGIALLSSTDAIPKGVRRGAMTGGGIGLLIIAGFATVLISPILTASLGRGLQRVAGPFLTKRAAARGAQPLDLEAVLAGQRTRLASVTRTGWFPMTVGVVGFLGVYFVLFWRTMTAVGVDISLGKLFAAYAVGRLLTAVGVTPGGLGITEAGTLAVLVAWGADKPAAAAGVLVFALFTHILEVPLGLLGGLAWWFLPRTTSPNE